METISSSENSVAFPRTALSDIPEDRTLHIQYRDNLNFVRNRVVLRGMVYLVKHLVQGLQFSRCHATSPTVVRCGENVPPVRF
jgi:hypothetical protein